MGAGDDDLYADDTEYVRELVRTHTAARRLTLLGFLNLFHCTH